HPRRKFIINKGLVGDDLAPIILHNGDELELVIRIEIKDGPERELTKCGGVKCKSAFVFDEKDWTDLKFYIRNWVRLSAIRHNKNMEFG
ncbi:MAG: hypothetical protein ACYTEW_21480, partial [Planctomycetota bacterium]